MAPLPAAPKVIRISLSGTVTNGGVWLTRFYVRYDGTAPTNADLTTFNASVATAYTANIRSLVDTATTLTQIVSVDLSSTTAAEATSAVSVVGTRAGSSNPSDVAMLVSYEIQRRYRGGHPRAYFRAGVAADVATARTWSAAFVASTLTGVNALFTAIVAAGWAGAGTLTHVSLSYFNGFTVVVNPLTGRARNVPTLRAAPTIDAVTSVVPRLSLGTQRRRLAFTE